MLPALEGRLDNAQHAVTAVVLGIRRVEDACGTYFDLRLFPEVHLGGREAIDPRDATDNIEVRALMYMPNPKALCDEPQLRVVKTNQVAVGDRIMVALGQTSSTLSDVPMWKRRPRVVAIGPVGALPMIAAALPKPRLEGDSEQFVPVLRMPNVGTPASVRFLGKGPRYEVVGEEIIDRAQGIVWQRDLAKKSMSFDEAGFYCEALRMGGHDDWRLPTAVEMHGTFAPSIPPPAVLDPKLFSAPEDALLWTRTDDDGPWVGSPHDGIVISTHYDDPSPYGNYHVRCVRPGVTRATEMVDRFAEKDGVLLDALSGLSWYLPPQKQVASVTQEEANRICKSNPFGDSNDWTVPTVEAAFSLMSACPEALENWEGTADDVWTSMADMETHVGGTYRICNLHRSVPLAAVFEQKGVDGKNPLARMMCVRETRMEREPDQQPCLTGSQLERTANLWTCKEKGILHGPFRSLWPSGGLYETGTYDHGVRSGMFVMYHEAGGIYARGDYVQGKLHGDIWARRPTGIPLFKGAYLNGLPSGRWTFFDTNGREVEHIDMVAGEPGAGQYVRYGDTGAKVIECPTMGGWEHGVERTFEEKSGRVFAESTYEGGWLEGLASTFDGGQGGQTGRYHQGERDGVWWGKNREGEVVFTQSFRLGKLDGVQESFGPGGKLLSSRRYRNGIAIGTWELHSSDGVLEQKGTLDEDGTGVVTSYDDEHKGEVKREERYLHGKRHGTWVEYYRPGQLRRKEEYRDDHLESVTDWYEDGKVAAQVTYSAGIKNGLAQQYDTGGRVRSKGSYRNGLREGRWEFMTVTGHHYEVVFEKGRAVRVGDATE
jgi:antitoxin component YwqK of YwqJK toxin-antitoxin module